MYESEDELTEFTDEKHPSDVSPTTRGISASKDKDTARGKLFLAV